MSDQPKGHGLIIQPPSETDYVSGDGRLTGAVINPSGSYRDCLPVYELQAPYFETSACASEGTENAYAILNKRLYGTDINLSARVIAKGSNTDPARGNTPQAVAEWFRKNWSVLEEEWPTMAAKTVEEYYAPLPASLLSNAKRQKGNHVWGYENIRTPSKANLRDALTKGAVCMSVSLMLGDDGRWYKPAGWSDTHWVTLFEISDEGEEDYFILDTYAPFIKRVRGDFVTQCAYRYTLDEVVIDGILATLSDIIKKLTKWFTENPPLPAPKPAPVNNLLNTMALAIKKHEGWATPGQTLNGIKYLLGSVSYRCNNPGNARFSSVGYLPKYGEVKEYRTGNEKPGQKGFAQFKDYETGFLYLKNLILEKARKHPHWNLFEFFGDEKDGWAPKSDGNNYIKYAETVAANMGVNPASWRISSLL